MVTVENSQLYINPVWYSVYKIEEFRHIHIYIRICLYLFMVPNFLGIAATVIFLSTIHVINGDHFVW